MSMHVVAVNGGWQLVRERNGAFAFGPWTIKHNHLLQ